MQIDRSNLSRTLWGRIFLWYLHNGGSEPTDTCGMRAMWLFKIPGTWLFEAGFLTPFKIIRPITALYLALLSAYVMLRISEITSAEVFNIWAVFGTAIFSAYFAFGILSSPVNYEKDPKKLPNRWVDRMIWMVGFVAISPMFALLKLLVVDLPEKIKPMLESKPFQLLGSFFSAIGDVLGYKIVNNWAVWHVAFIVIAAAVFAFVPGSLWFVVVVLAWLTFVCLAVYGVILGISWLFDTAIPAMTESAAQRRKRLHDQGRLTTNDMIGRLWKSFKNKVCFPIKWIGEYRAS